MVGSVNYPSPVTVNGYSCRNCTEVDNAKKHIDPSDPAAGPFGMNKTESARAADKAHAARSKPAHPRLDDQPSTYSATAKQHGTPALGRLIDISG